MLRELAHFVTLEETEIENPALFYTINFNCAAFLWYLYTLGGFCYSTERQFGADDANKSVTFSWNPGEHICRRNRNPSVLTLFRIDRSSVSNTAFIVHLGCRGYQPNVREAGMTDSNHLW